VSFVGSDLLEQVEPDRPIEVGNVEIYDAVDPPPGDIAKKGLGHVSVRIDHREAVPVLDVLDRKVLQKRRLAGTRFPDDVDVVAAIRRLDAKNSAIPAVGGLR